MKEKLLFGTNNPNKLREIREILEPRYQVLSLKDLNHHQDVEETETTLEGNAILKAKAFYEATGVACFADDTGLEVEALNWEPGVYTARYAGPECSPDDNIDKMLRELGEEQNRFARFRTVIAYYDGEQTLTFEGEARGNILHGRTGEGGFGYDPIFQPEGHEISFAQMAPADKNAISHRGKAVRKFSSFILGDTSS